MKEVIAAFLLYPHFVTAQTKIKTIIKNSDTKKTAVQLSFSIIK